MSAPKASATDARENDVASFCVVGSVRVAGSWLGGVVGEGGTGKSYLIAALDLYARVQWGKTPGTGARLRRLVRQKLSLAAVERLVTKKTCHNQLQTLGYQRVSSENDNACSAAAAGQ